MRWSSLDEAAARGSSIAYFAERHPERTALRSERGQRSYAALDARADRLARALRRAGLQPGEGVALLSGNRIEFAETFFAAQRCGARLTPVSWHLEPEEVAYVVADSGARAFVADAAFPQAARAAREAAPDLALALAVGEPLPGFRGFEEALAAEPGEPLPEPVLGDTMLYTSGTTGRPKGVRRPRPAPEQAVAGLRVLTSVFGFRPEGGDAALATGPLYHSGPLNLCLAIPVGNGIPTVLMERWQPEEMLRLVEAHRITHTYCVPTMFHRLLQLPEATRARYDLSSLRFVIHGAAPCPVEVKRAILDWLGPIVTELYAATEGMGTLVSPEEWLRKPGTVGRPLPGTVRILDGRGGEVPPGEVGTVFLRPVAGGEFEYWGDAEKTAAAKRDGAFTVGDMGYLDEDGYLFLTGRSAEIVISGGTNVYPAEIDDALVATPGVQDAAAFGVPDPEWGEVVCAAVVPVPGEAPDEALAQRLLEAFRSALPTIRAPRRVAFVDEIPRSEAGKILRRVLRERFAGDAARHDG